MDARNEQVLAHGDTFGRDPEALLADLQSGLDGLRSLLSEIDARERALGLETLRSVFSQFDKLEQQDT